MPDPMAARCVLSAVLAAGATAQEWLPLDDQLAFGGNVAFDRARARAVLFGRLGTVFELEGARSLHRAVDGPGPGPRQGPSLVFDEARGHVLLFGGRGGVATLGDTWTWDGMQWQQPFSLLSPPRRRDAALAYDAARQRVVLHGGSD